MKSITHFPGITLKKSILKWDKKIVSRKKRKKHLGILIEFRLDGYLS